MNRIVALFKSALYYLLFLPNVFVPLPVGRIETFPWATFFAMDKRTTLQFFYILIMVLFGISAVYSWLSYGEPISVLRSYLALINASIIFFRIIGTDEEDYLRIVRAMLTIFSLQVLLSLWQRSGTFPALFTQYFEIFIPRFTDNTLGGGRGVAGFYAEPAYAGMAVHYFFAFLMLYANIHPFSKKGLALISVLLLYNLTVSRSATDIAMLAVFLVGFINRKTLMPAMLFVASVLVLTIWYVEEANDPPRSLQLVYNLFFTFETDDPYLTILNESGFRLVSMYSGYAYGILHPLGGGVGAWPVTSLVALEATGVNPYELYYYLEANDGYFYPTRPSSFASDLFLEAGVVGFTLYMMAFGNYLRLRQFYVNPFGRAILVMFLFNFFLLGTIGDPIPAAILGLAYVAITRFGAAGEARAELPKSEEPFESTTPTEPQAHGG